jgi:uncharacterized metal-binding protein YceD (DUF177 family)
VDKLREYKIAFRGLTEGKHTFNYLLDENFFNCFEATQGVRGKLEAVVVLTKTNLLMDMKIHEKGSVFAICDRCLGECELPIEGNMELIVKVKERESGNDDDYIVLTHNDDFLDVAPYLYELYMLNYPIKVVHCEGSCDEDMDELLDKYLFDDNDKPTDLRWNELKKLINN